MSAAAPHETAHAFACHGEALIGIVSHATGAPTLGALIIVGGPQYRAGSHRSFVRLARGLAAAGVTTMRFDHRGMGDATGDARSFEALSDDIDAAIRALMHAAPSVRSVVLIGLCDAASAALLHAHEHPDDARIAGFVLLNPWLRSDQGEARAQVSNYYAQRLRDPAFWRKLVAGGVSWRAPGEFVGKLRLARQVVPSVESEARSFRERMADGFASTRKPIWLVISGRDPTAAEFVDGWQNHATWAQARQRTVTRLDLPEADHTLSQRVHFEAFAQWLVSELSRLAARPASSHAAGARAA